MYNVGLFTLTANGVFVAVAVVDVVVSIERPEPSNLRTSVFGRHETSLRCCQAKRKKEKCAILLVAPLLGARLSSA